jgi:hypothetical protein
MSTNNKKIFFIREILFNRFGQILFKKFFLSKSRKKFFRYFNK